MFIHQKVNQTLTGLLTKMYDFSAPEKVLKLYFRIVGFRMDDPPEPNKYIRLLIKMCEINLTIAYIQLLIKVFLVDTLMEVVILLQIFCLTTFGVYLRFLVHGNKDCLIWFLQWIKDIYHPRDALSRRAIKKHFVNAPRYSMYLLWLAAFLCIAAIIFIMIFGTVAVNWNRTGTEFYLPIELYNFGVKTDCWWKFLIFLFQESLAAITVISYYVAMMGIFYLIYLHVTFRFAALYDIVQEMDNTPLNVWIRVVANMIVHIRE